MDEYNARMTVGGLSEAFEKELSETTMVYYAKSLMKSDIEMGYEEIIGFAFDNFSRFPFPKELIAKLKDSDPETNKNKAVAMISKIRDAVRKHGYTNLESAREELGIIYFFALKGFGNTWTNVCTTDFSNASIIAQGRDTIRSILDLGVLDDNELVKRIEEPHRDIKQLISKTLLEKKI